MPPPILVVLGLVALLARSSLFFLMLVFFLYVVGFVDSFNSITDLIALLKLINYFSVICFVLSK